MSSIAALGAQQAMQQSIATLKAAAQSQQAIADVLTQAVESGEQLAESGSRGSRVNITV